MMAIWGGDVPDYPEQWRWLDYALIAATFVILTVIGLVAS